MNKPIYLVHADEYKNYLYKITKGMELESVVHFGAIASTSFIDKQTMWGFEPADVTHSTVALFQKHGLNEVLVL